MNFNDFNVNIELPVRQAMRLMSILILAELNFERQRAELSQNILLEDDLHEINDVIDLCQHLLNDIDMKINNSIRDISKDRLKALKDKWRSEMKEN